MERRQGPGVAIVIAAYNASATLERSIRSALAEQEVQELVVVDDASTDKTEQIAHKLAAADPRVKVLRQESNLGPSAARNRAIADSTASWIGILDADDYFVPGRIRALLAFAESADLIADNRWQLNQSSGEEENAGVPPPLSFSQPETARACGDPRAIDLRSFVASNVTRRGQERQELGFIKPLMRRAFLEKHRLLYREDMRLGEDFDLYARALALGARMLLLPERGYVSVVRADSLSGRHSIHDLRQLRECNRTLLRNFKLSAAERRAVLEHYRSVDCRLQWRLLIEAVKQRSVIGCVKTFFRPWPVPPYLAEKLFEQAYARLPRMKVAR
jgi:succinoglycan biosynthesis protein ExoU